MRSPAFLITYCVRVALSRVHLWTLVCITPLILNNNCCVADEGFAAEGQRLFFLESIENPDLVGVNRVVVTSDNEFLYAASWRGDNLSIFSRTPEGQLKHLESLKNPILRGAIKLALNHDESQLAVICMRSSTILLFSRDAESGQLKPDGFGKAEMKWPTSVSFSPDSDYLYVGDAGGNSTSKEQSSIVIFRVRENGALEHVGQFTHPEMIGMRNVLLSRDGTTGNSLVVLDNDLQGRKLKLLRVIPGDDKIPLRGPSGLTFDAKQEFLHVAVENGDALTTFALREVGK